MEWTVTTRRAGNRARFAGLLGAAMLLVVVVVAPALATSRLDPKRPSLHTFWSLGRAYVVAQGHTQRNTQCSGAFACEDYVQLERSCWGWCQASGTRRWFATTTKYGARKGSYAYSTQHVGRYFHPVQITIGLTFRGSGFTFGLPASKWTPVARSSHQRGETLRFTAPYSYRM